MVRSLVRADGDAAHDVEELDAVDAQDVRVVLRDHVAVLGELADDEAADHRGLAEGEFDGVGVEADHDGVVVLAEDGLEDGGGLLVEDEGGLLRAAHAGGRIANQLMGIGGHEGRRIHVDVEENTVHRGTHLVVGGRIDRAADAVQQVLRAEFDLLGVGGGTLDLRVVRGGEVGEGRIAVRPGALEGGVAAEGADADRLVRKGLEEVGHVARRHGDAAFLFRAVDADGRPERQLRIGGRDLQLIAAEDEKEVLEDG